MKRFANPCRRHRESLGLLASGLLSGPERTGIENHLNECADCRAYLDEMKALTAPLTAWEKHFENVEVSASARLRWARAVATAGECNSRPGFTPKNILLECWEQLIWPVRHIWAGLTVIWLLILGANVDFQSGLPRMTATASSRSADFMGVLQEQEQMMAELNGQKESTAAAPPVEPRKRPGSRPHSEWHSWYFSI
jgi:hypothetical protein